MTIDEIHIYLSDMKNSEMIMMITRGDTLNKLSEKTGSPPASNLEPPVFRSSARIELLSLSATYISSISVQVVDVT